MGELRAALEAENPHAAEATGDVVAAVAESVPGVEAIAAARGATAETGGTERAASGEASGADKAEAVAGGGAAHMDVAEEYEPDFEEDTDALTQQCNAADGASGQRATDESGGSAEEADGKRAADAKEVTWEEGPEQKAQAQKARMPPPAASKQRKGSRAVQVVFPPPAKVSSPPKPKKIESMRNNMRGTLASFRTAARTSDYDPNLTGILQQKMKKPEPVQPCRSLSQLRMWSGRPPVLPGGGGGGSWIASQPSIAASDEGAESMLIDSPEAPSSPSREVLRSPASSIRGFVPKRIKPKPPTSGDLARLSMYLTAQQHNKLKQHMQQMDRAASLALLYAQHAQASA